MLKSKSDLYGKEGQRTNGVEVKGIKMAKNINRRPYTTPDPNRNKFYDKYIWQQTRDSYRRANPLCEVCKAKDKLEPMTLVHHIHPIDEGGEELDQNNLMSLCGERCHRLLHAMIEEDKKRGVTAWTRDQVLKQLTP